ncbi:MAG TPA: hypothetical protein PLR64_03555, partial [Candidatus Dojkabacteria bacterium]|nr:hypothetical protein [Candidatus Dojkabacteria bacterium]
NFNKLWDRTKQLLRTLGIKFNDEDFIDINDEGVNNRDYSPEAFSTDWKKFSPYAVKLILYTLPKTKHQRKALLKLPEIITSGVKGYVPLQFSQAFATLMTKLSNTTELDEYEKKIVDLMKHDGDYVRLFNRLGGKTNEEGDQFFDYTNFGKADWRLFINFYQTFTKQHPEAVVQYTNGLEVYTGSAELFSPAQQLRDEWFQQMRILSASDAPIIKWNKKSKTYVVEKYSTAIPKTAEDALNFLEKIGVNIGMNIYGRLKTSPQGIEEKSQQQEFFEAVASIHTYLQKNKEISKINGDVMGIAGPLRKLSELVVKVSNPNRENIHYNVEDQPQQSNEENNYSSYFENEFNSCKTLDELLEKRPQLRDVFSTNSQILKKGGLFFNKAGKRIRDIKVMVIGGNKDTNADVGKKIAGLTRGERDVTQINQNINGVYYILIPADSATEWAMKLGNTVSYKSDKWQKIYDTFLGYLKDDVALALDYEKRGQLRNVGKKAKELRFFKDILSDNVIENMIEKGNTQQEIETYINDNIEKINKDIKAYIDEYNENTKKDLIDNGAVIKIGEEYAFLGLDSDFVKENELKKDKITEEELNDILLFVNSNYIINNIEFHKILFGDPLQFKTEKANIEE